MKKNLILTLILLGCLILVNSLDLRNKKDQNNILGSQTSQDPCNITHFEFQNNVSLANNDELNRTFKALGERITVLGNVTWKVNDSTTYTIYQAKPSFYYRDSKQKAEIVGNDTITIEGGFAEATIDFKWSKTVGSSGKYGTATVWALSDQIAFAKDLVIDGDFFRFQLLDYRNVTFFDNAKLLRVSPPQTTTDEQKEILTLVNYINNVTTLKDQLAAQIALSFAFILKMNLYNQNHPIDEHFFYKWTSPVPSKGELVINFTRKPSFIDIQRDGIHYGYLATIDGYNNSKCGPMPPAVPMNERVYGGSQQFISYTFYENVIRFAAERGQLDTDLTRDLWESRMFQFYAGDLYQIFPKVAENYPAKTQVVGNCKANVSQLTVAKQNVDTFNVSMHFNCQLSINRTKILDFNVGFELEIQGRPQADSIDFYLKSHKQHAFYYPAGIFVLQNEELADAMVKHSLNRLYEGKLFGSGWPLHPSRDYPHFQSEAYASFVYDSTHVDTMTYE